jgi:uncharacterized cupredoxin-like copper-binding protein
MGVASMSMVAAILAVGVIGCSSRDTSASRGRSTVHVELTDTTGLNGPLTLTASPAKVNPGTVMFVVKNTGTIDHSMIVVKSGTPFNRLPIVDGGSPPASVATGANEVDEAGKVGGIGAPDLKPGETRTFKIKNMVAGKYVLLSNIAKQYGMGMRTGFTVR